MKSVSTILLTLTMINMDYVNSSENETNLKEYNFNELHQNMNILKATSSSIEDVLYREKCNQLCGGTCCV